MKFTLAVNNFTAGVWSPKMYSRNDSEQYLKACSELKNFLAQVHGGAQYRAGFSLFEILASSTQGDYNTAITNPGTTFFKLISYRPFGSANSAILCISATPDMFHALPTGTPVNTTNASLSLSGWNPHKTSFVQLGNYLLLVDGDGNNEPHVFYWRSGYVLETVRYMRSITVGKPWKAFPWEKLVALESGPTMTVTGTMTVGGSVTITASANFPYSFVGSYMRFCNSNKVAGVVEITGVSAANVFTGTVKQAMPEASGFVYGSITNGSSFWQRSMWTAAGGFPRTVTAFEGRVIYGGSLSYPDTLWGSRISDYFDFEEVPEPTTTGIYGFASSAFTADNSRPFALTPNSPEASNIVAVSAGKSLAVHTEKSEIVCYGSNGALGPNNAKFDSSTSFGAKQVQPVRVNNFSTFVQAKGLRIRDIIFSFNEDQFKSSDLNFVADHLLLNDVGIYSEVAELVRWEGRSSYLVVRTVSGKIIICTLDRDYQVNAWSEVDLGKYGDPENTYCYAICEHRGSIFALIKRPVVSGSGVSLEKMDEPWEYANPYNDEELEQAAFDAGASPVYLDGSMLATGTDTPVDGKYKEWNVSGENMEWFDEKTVSVVADGNYIGEVEVDDSGNFSTTTAYASVYVGFKYEGVIAPLPLEAGSQYGNSLGRIKRIDEAVVKFLNTNGVSVGSPAIQDELVFREPSQPMNEATDYFTGDKVVTFPANYSRAAQVVIKQTKPYPAYVVSVAVRGQTFEG